MIRSRRNEQDDANQLGVVEDSSSVCEQAPLNLNTFCIVALFRKKFSKFYYYYLKMPWLLLLLLSCWFSSLKVVVSSWSNLMLNAHTLKYS